MGIAERFTTAAPARPCKVARVVAELRKADREAVQAALDGPTPGPGVACGPDTGWSDEGIAANLTDEGHPLSDSTVRVHRRGACSCYR